MTEHVHHGLASEELQEELRDLLDLAVVGDHVRWVIVGDEAGELADWLAEAVPQWRALAERVSRHLVNLGVAPDGRVRSLAKDIPVHWVPEGWLRPDEVRRLVADRLRVLGGWACYRRSQATNPDTVQLLDAVCSSLKAQARAAELMIFDIEHIDAPAPAVRSGGRRSA
jgi:starvation-inducible DNA-binding protein